MALQALRAKRGEALALVLAALEKLAPVRLAADWVGGGWHGDLEKEKAPIEAWMQQRTRTVVQHPAF